jgi:predicted DNA-binding transcriptional regulator AlpA
MTPSPLDPMIEAIAQRVAAILAPLITNDHAVKPRLLTVAQCAIYIGRTEKSVYMLQANGAFPAVRADSRIQFDIADLDKWIRDNKENQ